MATALSLHWSMVAMQSVRAQELLNLKTQNNISSNMQSVTHQVEHLVKLLRLVKQDVLHFHSSFR